MTRDTTSPATPQTRYRADLDAGAIVADAGQVRAVAALERVYQELVSAPAARAGLLSRLLGAPTPRWSGVRGLYLWGSVGRGKTYLVDTFYEVVPFAHKRRTHFHRFMRAVHEALRSLDGQQDPLATVAARWAADCRLLCLDEFHVGDITDAMLLANLLNALLDAGVTLIATSNERPADLYAGGLQRERFLPAIALIEQQLEVLELDGDNDYRLRALEQAPVYYVGAPGDHDAALAQSFTAIAPDAGSSGGELIVEQRPIATVRQADGVVWLSFEALCGGPRSTADYIELAREHHTMIVSDVPVMGNDNNDPARRFINFVDEIYDRSVNLIVTAAAEPEALYTGQRLAKPFLRTASRLREMRSHDYLARPHSSD